MMLFVSPLLTLLLDDLIYRNKAGIARYLTVISDAATGGIPTNIQSGIGEKIVREKLQEKE